MFSVHGVIKGDVSVRPVASLRSLVWDFASGSVFIYSFMLAGYGFDKLANGVGHSSTSSTQKQGFKASPKPKLLGEKTLDTTHQEKNHASDDTRRCEENFFPQVRKQKRNEHVA